VTVDVQQLGGLSDEELATLYAPPAGASPWLRVNMISTLDGAATGPDGRSGGINDEADHRVFATLRELCDAVVVGAGTARDEGYSDLSKPLVLVTRRASVPEGLRGEEPGSVLLATTAAAEHLDEARELLGADHVLVTGEDDVDLVRLKRELGERGWRDLLAEGGPSLLRDLLAAGVVDELDLTWVPRLLAGDHPRITGGDPIDVTMRSAHLLVSGSTLLGRWLS
jgi:riboflavin biosynthesis pyrimidine reductase